MGSTEKLTSLKCSAEDGPAAVTQYPRPKGKNVFGTTKQALIIFNEKGNH